MEKESPSYYAIIPASVRYADIPANAKLLYGEITALCNKEGYCWASNRYFAELYSVHKNSIGRLIGILKEKGFITLEDKKEQQKGGGVSTKRLIGINKNVEYNNTSINNTSNNTCENEFSQEIPLIIEKFKKISPSLSYGNKTQRNACHEMIKMFGINEVMRMVDVVIGVQGEKYAPRATTPYAMWIKLGDFKAYLANKNNNKSIIAQV